MNIEKTNTCAEIYKEEFSVSLKSLRRSNEAWSKRGPYLRNDLFKYSDDDFYFFRFIVGREEQCTVELLNRILYRVMDNYHIDYEKSDEPRFDYIIKTENGRFGYRYEDFYEDEDINSKLTESNVDKAFIIRIERGYENRHLVATNNRFKSEAINAEVITLQTFFEKHFTADEFSVFDKYITEYIAQTKKIIGIKSIKVLSAMNLSARRAFEDNILHNWDYEHSKYKIIDPTNSKIQKYAYVGTLTFNNSWKTLIDNYLEEDLYKSMIGSENYAESFLSSEWLYYSLKEEENFDYTSIVTVILKDKLECFPSEKYCSLYNRYHNFEYVPYIGTVDEFRRSDIYNQIADLEIEAHYSEGTAIWICYYWEELKNKQIKEKFQSKLKRERKDGQHMEKEQPKRFTKEELKQLSNLAKRGTKYTLTENDFKELKEQMKRQRS